MSSYYPGVFCSVPWFPSLPPLPHQRSFMLPWFFYWKLGAKTARDQPWIISALLICINCCISPEYNKMYPNKEVEENALSLSLFWQMRWLLGDLHNWSEHFTWSANLILIRRERERGERNTERVWYSGIVSGLLLFSLQIRTAVNDMSISCLFPPTRHPGDPKNNNPKKMDS